MTKKIFRKLETSVYRNRYFRVVLDIYTPRPHYILLYNDNDKYRKNKRYKIRDIYDLPFYLWEYLIGTIEKTFKKFGPSIFSIHLGFYQSKESPNFHAHYYLPLKKYQQVYQKHYKNPDYLKKLANWKKKIMEEGAKYKKHDLQEIKKAKPITAPFPGLSRNYSIKFHDSQPRIAFIHNHRGPDHRGTHDLVWAMMEFANYYRLNDRNHGGCHLCLQNNLYISPDYRNVIGYLQVDIVNYYRINPNRKAWLREFRKAEYWVPT